MWQAGTQDFLYGTHNEIRVGAVNDFTSCLEMLGETVRISFCSLSDNQQFVHTAGTLAPLCAAICGALSLPRLTFCWLL